MVVETALALSLVLVGSAVAFSKRERGERGAPLDRAARLRWLSDVEALLNQAKTEEAHIEDLQAALEESTSRVEGASRQIVGLDDELESAHRLLEFLVSASVSDSPTATVREALAAGLQEPTVLPFLISVLEALPGVEAYVLHLEVALQTVLKAHTALEAKLWDAAEERDALNRDFAARSVQFERQLEMWSKKEASFELHRLMLQHELSELVATTDACLEEKSVPTDTQQEPASTETVVHLKPLLADSEMGHGKPAPSRSPRAATPRPPSGTIRSRKWSEPAIRSSSVSAYDVSRAPRTGVKAGGRPRKGPENSRGASSRRSSGTRGHSRQEEV